MGSGASSYNVQSGQKTGGVRAKARSKTNSFGKSSTTITNQNGSSRGGAKTGSAKQTAKKRHLAVEEVNKENQVSEGGSSWVLCAKEDYYEDMIDLRRKHYGRPTNAFANHSVKESGTNNTGKKDTVGATSEAEVKGKNGNEEYAEEIGMEIDSEGESSSDKGNKGHQTQASQWTPPSENWRANNDSGLPYGFEESKDKNGRPYYIRHEDETTQREKPTNDDQKVETDEPDFEAPREVELERDPKLGFGFVAGSEKPVVVRFVTEGGPSSGKLLPGDWLLRINDEDVEQAPREHVIQLVKSSEKCIRLRVCQPQTSNNGIKSALMTVAKRARLQKNPSRVRFADVIDLNGAPLVVPSSSESYIPFMPNVLKVFLDNGQTKSFKYDNSTTVKDVLVSLQEKLSIQCMEHFALVLQDMKSPLTSKMTFLQNHEILAQIAARPGSQHLKCMFRFAFVPRDPLDLHKRDPAALDYLFMQCTNDVIDGRYGAELTCDVAFRLGALHIQQHCLAHNVTKLSLKQIEKETGFDKFVPEALLDSVKSKDLRKMLTHYIKINQLHTPLGQKNHSQLQIKIHYLIVLNELRSFGGKTFLATIEEKNIEAMVLVGPKDGLSELRDVKSSKLSPLADFDNMVAVRVKNCDRETLRTVVIELQQHEFERLSLTLNSEEVTDLLMLLDGYYRVCVDRNVSLLKDQPQTACMTTTPATGEVPPYKGEHTVTPATWSYARVNQTSHEETKKVDLSQGPPSYHGTPSNKVPETVKSSHSKSTAQHSESHTARTETVASDGEQSDTEEASQQQDADTTLVETGEESTESDLESSNTEQALRTSYLELLKLDSGKHDENANDPVYINGSIDRPSPPDTPSETSENDLLTTGRNIELTDSTLDSSLSTESLRDDGFAKSVRDAMTHAQARIEAEKVKTGSADETSIPTILHDRSVSVESEEILFMDTTMDEEQNKANTAGETSAKTNEQIRQEENTVQMRTPKNYRRERPGSFGLHSPDKVPQSAAELAVLTNQYRAVFKPPSAQADNTSDSETETAGESERNEERRTSVDFNHPSYNPKLFCDGGLYLDPDIIDLRLIPPPEDDDKLTSPKRVCTPRGGGTRNLSEEEEGEESEEEEELMDFTRLTEPPAAFTDSQGRRRGLPMGCQEDEDNEDDLAKFKLSLPPGIRKKIDSVVDNDEELSAQLAAIDALLIEDAGRDENEKESGIDSESEGEELSDYSHRTPTCPEEVLRRKRNKLSPEDMVQQLARRQSYQHINFTATDIDAFIASVTVPPPPPLDEQSSSSSSSGLPLSLPNSPFAKEQSKQKTSDIPSPPSRTKSRKGMVDGNDITPNLSRQSSKTEKSTRKEIDIERLIFDGQISLEDILDPSNVVGEESWKEFLENSKEFDALKLSLDDDISELVVPPPESESNELDLASIPRVLPPSLSPVESPRSQDGDDDDTPRQKPEVPLKPAPAVTQSSSSGESSPTKKNRPVPSIKPSLLSMPTSPTSQTVKSKQPKQEKLLFKPKVDPQTKPKISEISQSSVESAESKPALNDTSEGSKGSSDIQSSSEQPKKHDTQDIRVNRKERKTIMDSQLGLVSKASAKSMPESKSIPPDNPPVSTVASPSRKPVNTSPMHARSISIIETESASSIKDKRAAPPPPKRLSSLDPTDSSPVHSPRYSRQAVRAERPQSALVESQTEADTVAEQVSPRQAGMSSTLPRGRIASEGAVRGRRKPAPPPPPRRSSVLKTAAEMHELSRSEDNLQVQAPRFSTFGQQQGRTYQKMFGNRRPQNAQSKASIFTMFSSTSSKTLPNTASKSSASSVTPTQSSFSSHVTHSSRRSPHSPHKVSPQTPPVAEPSKSPNVATVSGPKLKLKMPDPSAVESDEVFRDRKGSDSSSTGSQSPRTRAKFVSPTIKAKQKAIATAFSNPGSVEGASPHVASPASPMANGRLAKPASPLADHRNVHRRPGSPAGTLTKPHSPSPSPSAVPGSPSLSRSNTFTQASSTIPRAYVSPQTSPALYRHSSFSKAAEKSSSPFRTFLGDNRTPSGSASMAGATGTETTSSDLGTSARTSVSSSSPCTPPSQPESPGFLATSSPRSETGSIPSSVATEPLSPRRYFPARKAPSRPDMAPPVLPMVPQMNQQRRIGSPSVDSGLPKKHSYSSDSGQASTTFSFNIGAALNQTRPGDSKSHNNSDGVSVRHASSGSKISFPIHHGASAQHSLNKAPSLPIFNNQSEESTSFTQPPPQMRRYNSIESSTPAGEYDIGDIVYEIQARNYAGPNTFVQANMDVDSLVQLLNLRIANLAAESSGNVAEFETHKERLFVVSRTFVGDSKQLVSSATQSHEHVVERVDASMHTLAAMVQHCVLTLPHTSVAHQLGTRLIEVARAYKTTVNAAAAAAGKSLNDTAMKLLMRQATSLASILSQLMKTLRSLEH